MENEEFENLRKEAEAQIDKYWNEKKEEAAIGAQKIWDMVSVAIASYFDLEGCEK